MAQTDMAADLPEPVAEDIVVETPEAFKAMPQEYQELAIHQMLVHTEGELTGADDYIHLFYPMAPNAYEKLVCCERAAEEMDHYMIGSAVLADLGVDTSNMLDQHFQERPYYPNEIVRYTKTWMERGFFSFLGEQAVFDHLLEMQQSSYRPWGRSFEKIIKDEKVHIAHGYRIVREACKTPEGLEEAQQTLNYMWPMVLDLFGRSDSKRSKLYLKWGLRKHSNAESRPQFIAKMRPKLQELGLEAPDDHLNRKFL